MSSRFSSLRTGPKLAQRLAAVSLAQLSDQHLLDYLHAETRQLLDSLERSNPNMRVMQQNHAIINGHQAVETWFENDSPIQGQREKDRLVTLESGGGLLTLIFIAPQSVFDSYQPAFEAMLRSLSVG